MNETGKTMGKTTETGITRRRFFGAAAVTTVAASGMGLAGAVAGAQAAESQEWDMECDVVVAGSGSGTAAAAIAAARGAETILLEKAEHTGGSLKYSGGGVWIANSTYSQEFGDDEQKARAYLTACQRGEGDDALTNAFYDDGQAMLDELAEVCDIQWRSSTYCDYHPEWEGAMMQGRGLGVQVREDDTLMGGALLADRLITGAEAHGVQVLTSTAAKRLVTAEAPEGGKRVIGVEAETSERTLRIKARKGVILACGGFEWDEELRKNYVGGPGELFRSLDTNTGDALRMAMRVGADLRMMNACWGNVVYKEEAIQANGQGLPVGTHLLMDRAKPHTIIVDRSGKRFCDEACDYDTLWWAFLNRETWGDTNRLGDGAWLVADSQMVEKFGLCTGNDLAVELPPEIVVADTLDELAGAMGIDPAAFSKTVADFNTDAAQGVDTQFHRGESAFDCGFMCDYDYVGTPQATLGTLEVAPFYALEVAPAITGTHGGPHVDGNARVLDVDGNPIGGLYAAGNCAGIGAPGMVYPGPGGSIGPALVFCHLAAVHASAAEPIE